jgi:hypothetical protein
MVVDEEEIKDSEKQEVIFSCFAFFCMSLHTSLYGAIQIHTLIYKMVYLKNMTDILGDSTTNRHLILH